MIGQVCPVLAQLRGVRVMLRLIEALSIQAKRLMLLLERVGTSFQPLMLFAFGFLHHVGRS